LVGVGVRESDGFEAGAVAAVAGGVIVRATAGASAAETVVPGLTVEGVVGMREVGVRENAFDPRYAVDATTEIFALAPV